MEERLTEARSEMMEWVGRQEGGKRELQKQNWSELGKGTVRDRSGQMKCDKKIMGC